MSAIDEAYVIKQYGDSHSTYSIAKELGTYPVRQAKEKDIPRRSKKMERDFP